MNNQKNTTPETRKVLTSATEIRDAVKANNG